MPGLARSLSEVLTPRSLAVADLDGDGADDVVAGNLAADSVSVLLNAR